ERRATALRPIVGPAQFYPIHSGGKLHCLAVLVLSRAYSSMGAMRWFVGTRSGEAAGVRGDDNLVGARRSAARRQSRLAGGDRRWRERRTALRLVARGRWKLAIWRGQPLVAVPFVERAGRCFARPWIAADRSFRPDLFGD